MSTPQTERVKPGSTEEVRPAVKVKSTVREYAEALVVALALALFFRSFFEQALLISSGSMLETLQICDHLLVN